MSEDMKIGIDPSEALKGSKDFDRAITNMVKSADRLQGEAGAKVDALFSKLAKLSNVSAISNAKVSALSNLADAMNKLGNARGPSKSAVENLGKLTHALSQVNNAGDFTKIGRGLAQMSGFRGPSASSVTQTESLINTLKKLSGVKGFRTDMLASAAAIRQLNEALATLPSKAASADGALKRTGASARKAGGDMLHLRTEALSMSSALLRTREFLGGFAAIGGLGSIFGEIDKIQKSTAALTGVTGNMAASISEMEQLKIVASDLKIYIGDLSQNYAQFRAGAQSTNLTVSQTQTIFKQVAQAGRVFGLSNDDVSGTFRALTQMMSKGAVQMEELRQQFGDRLPGAMGAAAKAMGVTTAKLFEMVKNKEITGKRMEEFMVGLGSALETMTKGGLSAALTTISAMLAQLHNSFNDFAMGLGQAGMTETFAIITQSITDLISKGSPFRSFMEGLASVIAFMARNADGLQFAVVLLGTYMAGSLIQSIWKSVAAWSSATLAAAANAAATTTQAAATTGAAVAAGSLAIAEGTATVATIGLTEVMIALNIAMEANPILWLISIIAVLVGGLATWEQATSKTTLANDALRNSVNLTADAAFSSVSSISVLTEKYKDLGTEARKAASETLRLKLVTKLGALQDSAEAQKAQAKQLAFAASPGNNAGVQPGSYLDQYTKRRVATNSQLSNFSNATGTLLSKVASADDKTRLTWRDKGQLETALNAGMDYLEKARRSGEYDKKQLTVLETSVKALEDAIATNEGTLWNRGTSGFLNGDNSLLHQLGVPDTPELKPYGSPETKKGTSRPEMLQALSGTPAEIISKSSENLANQAKLDAVTSQGVIASKERTQQLDSETKVADKAKSAWDRYQQSIPKRQRQSWDSVKEGSSDVAKSILDAAKSAVFLDDKLSSIDDLSGLVDSIDPVYSAIGDVTKSMATLKKFTDSEFNALFPESALTRAQAMERALNDAFKDISSLDTVTQINRAWEDGTASLHAYIIQYRDLHPAEDKTARANREAILSTKSMLKQLADSAGAIGPVGGMAEIMLEFNTQLDTARTLAEKFGLSTDQLNAQIYTLTQNYQASAHTVVESTSAGKEYTATMEQMKSIATEVADSLDRVYGGRTFSRQIESIVQAQEAMDKYGLSAQTALSATRYQLPIGLKSQPTSSQSGEEVIVTGSKRITSLDSQIGLNSTERGMVENKAQIDAYNKMSRDQFQRQYQDAMDSFDTLSSTIENIDNGSVARMNDLLKVRQNLLTSISDQTAITTLMDKVNLLRNAADIKPKVDMTSSQVVSAVNAQIIQVNMALADTEKQMQRIRLESGKIGKVLSGSIDDLASVLDNYMETGKMDTEDLFKSIRSGIRRAVIIDPLMDVLRKGMSSAMSSIGDMIAGSGSGPVQTYLSQLFGKGKVGEDKDVLAAVTKVAPIMQSAALQYKDASTQFSAAVQQFISLTGQAVLQGQITQSKAPAADPTTTVPPVNSDTVGTPTTGTAQGKGLTDQGISTADALFKTSGNVLMTAGTGLQNVSQMFLSSVIPSQYRGASSLIISAITSLMAARRHQKAAMDLSSAATKLSASTGSGAAGAVSGGSSIWSTLSNFAMSIFHKGGIVGEDGVRRRLNSRGIVNGSEQLIIAQKGEEVLTADDPRHADNYTGMPVYQKQVVSRASSGDTNYTVATSNVFHVTATKEGDISQDDLNKMAIQINKSMDAKIRATIGKTNTRQNMRMN